ncbi:MAG: DNA polymerase/3'-5' exonuclease PolX [Phycisphaerales bacterium]|nr:DNA polymerase/3'-5' exonuclease PolX [Phycisphaerales bacterium]
MGVNQDIAALLEQIAALLELNGADSFRASAHARAARAIEDHPTSLADHRDAIDAIPGVGKKIAEKIREYLDTGAMSEHQELLAATPPGLLQVLEIPGLGPKTVRAMWQTIGVDSLDALRRAIDDGSILTVPRMGAKTVENIKAALTFAAQAGERMPLGVAMPIAEAIVARLTPIAGAGAVAYAGSLRRGKDTIGDIDILAAVTDGAGLGEAFRSMPEVTQVLAAGESKSSVRLKTARGHVVQADLRIVPPESFGAAMLYFTGSKEHNVRLRERALRMGMTLNEYGLYPEDKAKAPPQSRGVRAVASKTEADVYAALELPFVPPELREDAGELDRPAGQAFGLIEQGDVRAELHAHTTASDGAMSIEELARAAKSRGFHTIAVTDHSKSSAIAGGLSPERLLEHIEAVHAARRNVEGVTILAGSEVDILADGSLDYEDELLARLDIVVASPHASLRQSEKEATARLIRAVQNPYVRILGHPTGRIINKRAGLSIDIRAVAEAAAARNVALEINANWLRLDLRDAHVRAALEAGSLIAIDCDVHAETDFDHLRYGVLTGRRGGLTPERCVNTWSAERLRAWLRREPGPEPKGPKPGRKPARR